MNEPTPFARMLFGLLDRAELIALAVLLGGLGASFAGFTGVDAIMVFAFAALAAIYFLMAYRPSMTAPPSSEQKSGFIDLFSQTILPKLLWITCAVGAAGLSMLYTRPDNNGYHTILLMNATAGGAGVFMVGWLHLHGKANTLIPVLYRAVPLALTSIYIITKQ